MRALLCTAMLMVISVLGNSVALAVEDSEQPLYVLIMGQSNAVGWHWSTEDQDNPGGAVKLWHWQDREWQIWNPYLNPPQTRFFNTPLANNIAFHFGKKFHEETGREVRVIFEAEGGKSITHWVPKSGPRYQGMLEQLSDSGVPRIDVILWHQGEADVWRGIQAYEVDFDSLLSQLRSEPQMDDQSVFIAGQVSNKPEAIRGMNQFFAPTRFEEKYHAQNVYLAQMGNFEVVDGDEWHFKPSSLVKAGREAYYHAYLQSVSEHGSGTGENQIPEYATATQFLPKGQGGTKIPLSRLLPQLDFRSLVGVEIESNPESNQLSLSYHRESQSFEVGIPDGFDGTGKFSYLMEFSDGLVARSYLEMSVVNPSSGSESRLDIAENGGSVNILIASLGLPGSVDLSMPWYFRVGEFTQDSLMEITGMSENHLSVEPKPGRFGNHHVTLEFHLKSGGIHQHSLHLTVVPETLELGSGFLRLSENQEKGSIPLVNLFPGNAFGDGMTWDPPSVSNPEAVMSIEIKSGMLIIEPAANFFGGFVIRLSGFKADGRPVNGSMDAEVFPIPVNLGNLSLTAPEDSAPLIISPADLIGSAPVDDLQQVILREPVRNEIPYPEWASVTVADANQFRIEIAPGHFGSATFYYNGHTANARPLNGTISLTILPHTRTIPSRKYVFDPSRNEAVVSLDSLLNSGTNPTIDSSTFALTGIEDPLPDFIQSVEVVDDSLQFTSTSPHAYGRHEFRYSASQPDGRPVTGTLEIIFLAKRVDVTFPVLSAREGSGELTSLNLLDHFHPKFGAEITNFGRSPATTSSIIRNLTIHEGMLEFSPAGAGFGVAEIVIEAFDSLGVLYKGNVRVNIYSKPFTVKAATRVLTQRSGMVELSSQDIHGLSQADQMRSISPDFEKMSPAIRENIQLLDGDQALSIGYDLDTATSQFSIHLVVESMLNRIEHMEIPYVFDHYLVWLNDWFPDLSSESESTHWGESADPDRDGWDNLNEYYFGGSPIQRESKHDWIIPHIIRNDDGQGFLEVRWKSRSDTPQLSIKAEFSDDKIHWEASQQPVQKINRDDREFQFWRVTDHIPVTEEHPRYFRLGISRIPVTGE